jgi:hypothetical protein
MADVAADLSPADSLRHAMFDVCMAIEAFNFVLGDVVEVYFIHLGNLVDLLRITVALQAGTVLYETIPDNNIQVAALAGHSARNVLTVVVDNIANGDVLVRIGVTLQAELLWLLCHTVEFIAEVAQEASEHRNGHVIALHDLAVATGAAQHDSTLRGAVVRCVVKLDAAQVLKRALEQS